MRRAFFPIILFSILLALDEQEAFCQASLTSLAEIKVKAEAGDPSAQDKLGDAYSKWADATNAAIWYRKGAEKGIANSQYHLGKILVSDGYQGVFHKVVSIEKVNEGIRWYTLAARQRFQLADIDLGQYCEDGKIVKQDYVQAYKWYSLAHDVPMLEVVAGVYRDHLVLKMSPAQITEGQRKVAEFLASPKSESAVSVYAFVTRFRLSGISGEVAHPLAIINNHTFAPGEESMVKLDGQPVKIRCLEIHKNQVVISSPAFTDPIVLNAN